VKLAHDREPRTTVELEIAAIDRERATAAGGLAGERFSEAEKPPLHGMNGCWEADGDSRAHGHAA
jgi:hypothetical protein